MTHREKLIEEIETELEYLSQTVQAVNDLLISIESRKPSNIEIAASAQFLSQFYNGLENIFIRIIKFKNIPLPKSDIWHSELLNLFYIDSDVVKIPIIKTEEFTILISYKKIRHVIRQGYHYHLHWDRIRIALMNMPEFYENMKKKFLNYIKSI